MFNLDNISAALFAHNVSPLGLADESNVCVSELPLMFKARKLWNAYTLEIAQYPQIGQPMNRFTNPEAAANLINLAWGM